MRPQPQPSQNCETSATRTSLRSGDTMGIGEGARPRQAQNAAQPQKGLPMVPFFLFLFFSSYSQDSVFQKPCPAVDLPKSRCNSQGSRKATSSIQVVSITSIIPVSHTIPQPALGTDMLNSPTFFLSHYLYRIICIVLL